MASSPPSAAEQIKQYQLQPQLFIAIPSIFIVLTSFAVALRIHVRAIMLKTFGADDWLLLVAFAIFVGDCSLFVAMGRIELQQGLTGPLEILSAFQLIGMLIYVINQIVLKISMALFFLRILQDRAQRLIIVVSVSIYSAYEFALCFVALFQCGDPGAVALLTGASCMPWDTVFGPVNYIGGALNAIVDWIFVLTPIIAIYRTSMMPTRAIISVCVLIGIGALGSVASIARIPLLGELGIENSIDYFSGIIPLTLVSLTETGLGIMCISLATLRPLLDRMMGSIVTTIADFRSAPITALPANTAASRAPSRRVSVVQVSDKDSLCLAETTKTNATFESLPHIPEDATTIVLGQGMGFEDLEKGSKTRVWTETES